MANNSRLSRLFAIIIAVVVIGFGGYTLLTSDLEHIEDANGPDNIALTTITDEDIIRQEMGCMNLQMSTGLLNDGVTFKSDKFTGVYRVFTTNFFLDSDFLMDVAGFHVNSGNFRMALVYNDEIAATVEPDMFASCRLDDLNGSFSLVIAGESADFEFTLDRLFCEQFGISVGS